MTEQEPDNISPSGPAAPSLASTTNRIVRVNVGGEDFVTMTATLSCFVTVMQLLETSTASPDETIFLDRDPQLFRRLLSTARSGQRSLEPPVSQALVDEACFYGATFADQHTPLSDLSRDDIVRTLLQLPACHSQQSHMIRFAGLRLAGLNLTGLNLSHADFSRSTMNSSNVSECDLEHSRFSHTVATGLQAAGAHACSTAWTKAQLTGASFASADLSHSTFAECSLSGVRFNDATLAQARFQACDLEGADLSHACVDQASFIRCEMTSTTTQLAGIHGRHCTFSDMRLDAYTFSPSPQPLVAPIFSRCSLQQCVFDEYDLTGASFVDCDLSGASFVYACLNLCTFTNSNLSGANLFHASICNSVRSFWFPSPTLTLSSP